MSKSIEGYKNTSEEVRGTKDKGGYESICLRERMMGEERNREAYKTDCEEGCNPSSFFFFFSQLMHLRTSTYCLVSCETHLPIRISFFAGSLVIARDPRLQFMNKDETRKIGGERYLKHKF